MRTDGYVVVQPWMVTDYNLKGNKLLIYALIWGFSQDEQSCFYGSTRYITDYFKLSERAVVGILDELVDDGLLCKWSEPVNGRTTNRYSALRPAACSAEDDGCKNCNHEENAPLQKVQTRKKIIIKARIKAHPQLGFHRPKRKRSGRISGSGGSRPHQPRPKLKSSLTGTRPTAGLWAKPE